MVFCGFSFGCLEVVTTGQVECFGDCALPSMEEDEVDTSENVWMLHKRVHMVDHSPNLALLNADDM